MNPEFEREYARYLAGEMSEDERRSFEERVTTDPALSEEVYADLNLDAAVRQDKVARVPAHWWRWAAPLAAAALILVAINLLPISPRETGSVLRGGGNRIELLEPVGEIAAPPAHFEWTPVEGAAVYRFELLDDQARVVLRQAVGENSLDLEFATTPAGAWTVVALDELGEEMAASRTVAFRVAD